MIVMMVGIHIYITKDIIPDKWNRAGLDSGLHDQRDGQDPRRVPAPLHRPGRFHLSHRCRLDNLVRWNSHFRPRSQDEEKTTDLPQVNSLWHSLVLLY